MDVQNAHQQAPLSETVNNEYFDSSASFMNDYEFQRFASWLKKLKIMCKWQWI